MIRLADRESGLSARTIARRLSSVSGLYAYLVARGDTPVRVNPVPRGLMTRRQGGTMRSRMAPLVRVPRTLPRILSLEVAGRLVGALRTHRDRAMVLGMLLAGLRRWLPDRVATKIARGKNMAIQIALYQFARRAPRAARKVLQGGVRRQLPPGYPVRQVALEQDPPAVRVRATARATARTGVEMEALTAVAVALLTVYDMAKAIDRAMELGDIHLLAKAGGQSGDWRRPT